MNLTRPGIGLLACALALAGCGAGSGTSAALPASQSATTNTSATNTSAASSASATSGAPVQRGTVQFTILWPEQADAGRAAHPLHPGQRTRLIPVAAQSLRIALVDATDGTTIVAQSTTARPPAGQNTSTATLTGVKAIGLIAIASAYPNADGSGVAQATGRVLITAIANQTVTAPTLTMNSTIAALQVVPSPLTVVAGLNAPVNVSATDASGAVVLLPTAGTTIAYSVDNTTLATVIAAGNGGNIVGLQAGTATLTVTDSESGKSGASIVNIAADAGGLIVPIQ